MKTFKYQDGRELEVGTFYCIGKNYAKHAREMGGEVPKEPVVFLKPPNSYIPNGGSIIIPDFSENVHHEVELVVIIGDDTNGISQKEAHRVISGYAIGIDVTLRDIQQKAKDGGKPWAVAKGFRTSAPVSDIVSAEKIDNPDDLNISLSVNGKERQNSSTKLMERNVGQLVAYLSKVFGLRRGDAIFTGTPEGVGQIFVGDNITAELNGLVNLSVDVKKVESI